MAADPESYEGIAAQFAAAKAQKEREEASVRVRGSRASTDDNSQKELHFKASHGILVSLLIWIIIVHGIGLYFFTKGFLLTRLVLDDKSTCDSIPTEIAGQVGGIGTFTQGCWHPKTFDKAVIIIVDALRYDFTVPFRPVDDSDKAQHYHDALPLFFEMASSHPENAFLLPFMADPPTATLQRLKGLTTGTLPTFVDVGSNFAGTAIEEDNLVAQLRDAGKRLVHLGDDTWHSLFPGYFDPNLTHAYDSFNVWDLHTVDNGVTEHLLPLLQPANISKWDVIFGHYLGVDHAGHRYGPDHTAMASKLRQMDDTFRQVIDILDDSTLLVVMGDHGMDAKGDHGGESFDEVQAALWMYSKKGIFGRTSAAALAPPASARERAVGQIDLVPTLSLLLGLPIPFNNLGAPIAEAFIGAGGDNWKNLATVHQLAGAQIERYQQQYNLVRGLDSSLTSKPLALWQQAQGTWTAATKEPAQPASAPSWQEAARQLARYQEENLSVCRSLWARFDVGSMITGIAMLLGGMSCLAFLAAGVRGDLTEVAPFMLRRVLIGLALGACAGATLSSIVSGALLNSVFLGGGTGSLLLFATSAVNIRRRTTWMFPRDGWSWFALISTILPSIGFASNSYTIWEDEILLFFVTSFGILAAISSLRQKNLLLKALGFYQSALFVCLTRLASLSRLCREEQMPYCRSTYYASATSSTSATWQLFIPFVLAVFLPDVIKSYYRGTRSYEGPAVFWIGVAFRMGLLLTAVFWILDAADDGEWFSMDKDTLKTIRVSIAQVVLGLAFAAGSTYYAWTKPCVNIAMTPDDAVTSEKSPQSIADSGTANGAGSRVTILGYANTHGTRYFLLLTNFTLALVLLTKPMGHLALGTLVWQILCLLEIIDVNSLSSSCIGPVVLGLLGNFHFFKTGHQATLSAIQWESAFVPLRTIKYPWSPLLVTGNAFAAQILCTLAVPLVVLWKREPKRRGLLSDVAKAMATHMLFHATINLATTCWAGWLRRHLMLFRIFSPRWMTGSAVLLVTDMVGVLVAVGALRWNVLSVAEVFGWP
ncbi:MAG: mannose-ethanolamine phosphotransferase gpi13 [Caeruleum heppii]|nr:MAG: mannose-ethanolamine phosphotransferase gpi13 [Caeruleum heppii]